MLSSLRKKRFIKVVMWLLVVTFVIWGAGSAVTTSRNFAGMLFGKKIAPQEYLRSYTAVSNRAKMIYGDKLTQMQKFLNLESEAWDRLILLHYAKKQRIRVPDKAIIEKIASLPVFQSEGAFDKKAYDYIVQNIFGVTARDFEESVRNDLIISKVYDSAVRNVAITDNEVKGAYRAKNEKADISYIIIEREPFKADVQYEEAELRSYYEANKEQFHTPEKLDVYYVKIPMQKMPQKEPEEGPEKVESQSPTYEEREEKERVRQIATGINEGLANGLRFDALALEHGLELKETGPFAFGASISDIGLSYPFSIAAFGLSEEKPNNIVEDANAFYVIKLKKKMPTAVPSFKNTIEEVRKSVITQKADQLVEASAKNYLGLLKNGEDTLTNVAAIIKTEIKTKEDLSRETYVDGAGVNNEFNNACFSIEENGYAGPIRVQKGHAIIRLDKLKPIDEEKFEEEKEKFQEELFNIRKRKAFRDWFVILKEQAALKVNI